MYEKVIIIGAPRSGTNMLRNALVKINGVATWPCDEINYIWRYGNARAKTDEFTPDMATARNVAYIRRAFDKLAHKTNSKAIVEKTCANSLRVGFVNAVVPEAKYIFIVRDGIDAIASASLRWTAKLDLPYLWKKLRFVPPADIPYYGMNYLMNRASMSSNKEGRLSYWGPKISALEDQKGQLTLYQMCAIQWRECVERASGDLASLPRDAVMEIKYEDFVSNPGELIGRLAQFIGVELTDEERQSVVSGVRTGSVGKGRQVIDEQTMRDIAPTIKTIMERYGYPLYTSSTQEYPVQGA